MLTVSTLGMTFYGLYAAGAGFVDLVGPRRLELWANLGGMVFGVLLLLGAAFVRVLMPGGLALAIGALLGLQALAIHDAAHLYGGVEPAPQIARGAFAAVLVLLAHVGARHEIRRG
jgi:hypothetical protein